MESPTSIDTEDSRKLQTSQAISSTYTFVIENHNKSAEDNQEEKRRDQSLLRRVSEKGVSGNEIIWENLKEILRKEIVLKSNKMFEKYGGLDRFDYLPYNCDLHNNFSAVGEPPCQECKSSVLNSFLKDILATFESHTDFPPTIQRICELLLFPHCYTNTKSFLFALDKTLNSDSESEFQSYSNKRFLVESESQFNQGLDSNKEEDLKTKRPKYF
ncbi:PPP4R2 family protein [Cryptosporidium felis]|nr:PPP4R2 family protein [Cryptosporidium felis]